MSSKLAVRLNTLTIRTTLKFFDNLVLKAMLSEILSQQECVIHAESDCETAIPSDECVRYQGDTPPEPAHTPQVSHCGSGLSSCEESPLSSRALSYSCLEGSQQRARYTCDPSLRS